MGKAYIVGAGPGDPELITVKALKCIRMADVILYDRLVNRELLNEAKRSCEMIFCGKQPTHHTMKQEIINDLLVQFTSQGKIVVRLKGGDPFVFGRGGEEAAALAEHGLPFEVVPGITAGIAAPAYAGIPITHREYGNSFAVVTGHCAKGRPTEIDWASLVKAVDTIAIYMGIGSLSFICQELVGNGKDQHTPVAVIEQGTRAEQRTVTGTLGSIGSVVEKERVQNPAMIVVGDVVRFREKLLHLQGVTPVREVVIGKEVM